MFYTSKMTDRQFAEFVTKHPVSGGCGTHGAEHAAANQQQQFTNSLLSQASTVFGADSGVFNVMKNAYSQLLAMGPSQQGFSAAQQSAMNSAAITAGATESRGILAALGSRQAGAGGGNAPNASGIGVNARAQVLETVAGQTAGELNKIQQENWAQGNINWRTAGEELGKAPSVFNNLPGVDSAAQTGLKETMANAQAADAASNWWVKPVTGLAAGGLNMVVPGLGTAMATGGTGGGLKNPFSSGSSGTGVIDVGTPQYMPGGGPQIVAPTDQEAGMPALGPMPTF